MSIHDILPDEINLDGDWDEHLLDLYNVFCETFLDNPVLFRGRSILYDRRKIDDDKEEGFWHLITRDQKVEGRPVRLPDFPRARRIYWVRALIENYAADGVTAFRYLEGNGDYKVYIWIEDLDYVIILKELKVAYYLITSFCVDKEWLVRDLDKRRRKGTPL